MSTEASNPSEQLHLRGCCVRVKLNSKPRHPSSPLFTIYLITLIILSAIFTIYGGAKFRHCTTIWIFFFLFAGSNCRQTLPHPFRRSHTTSCQTCIIDNWIYLSCLPHIFNYSARQTSRQTKASMIHQSAQGWRGGEGGPFTIAACYQEEHGEKIKYFTAAERGGEQAGGYLCSFI